MVASILGILSLRTAACVMWLYANLPFNLVIKHRLLGGFTVVVLGGFTVTIVLMSNL